MTANKMVKMEVGDTTLTATVCLVSSVWRVSDIGRLWVSGGSSGGGGGGSTIINITHWTLCGGGCGCSGGGVWLQWWWLRL